jgi:hypothetical protein
MPRLKPGTIFPTPEEDAAITIAAMSDPAAMPFTDREWEAVKPLLRRGRPPAETTKEHYHPLVAGRSGALSRHRARLANPHG